MKLLIVESPSKAKTIQKYLGDTYIVRSSKGHLVDLPKSGVGIEIENDFKPIYEVSNAPVLKELKLALKDSEDVIIATDPDREGEAIGWHVARELGLFKKNSEHKTSRAVFTEITKEAIIQALKTTRQIDQNLVNAQQARRILDRLVGYKLSPLVWKKIRYGLSAGRVQSVALRLVVDREGERNKFVPEEYWDIAANFVKYGSEIKTKIEIKLKEQEEILEEDSNSEQEESDLFKLSKYKNLKPELKNESQVTEVVKNIQNKKGTVAAVNSKDSKRNPLPPFNTSTLQTSAINKFGFTAKRTMDVAQKLYEAGLITYMRTDSISISEQALQAIRSFILKDAGEKYLPKVANVYKTKSKVAQEAHEAIRPTDPAKSAEAAKLDTDQSRIYNLIRDRALASQAAPAAYLDHNVVVNIGDAEFNAARKELLFPGYLKYQKDNSVSNKGAFSYKLGQELSCEQLLSTQHFTQPPARYSEATLIKELENLGIGRPSTYAPTMQTIQQRGYVSKLGRYFIPTDTGNILTKMLKEHFSNIVDSSFTANMEDELDDVANGKLDWVKMLKKFYDPFILNIQVKDKEIKQGSYTNLGKAPEQILCPVCNAEMVIKLGRFGKFYSCSRYPDCDGMLAMPEESVTGEPLPALDMEDYNPGPKTLDGIDYLLKKGRFGMFWAHPDYPKVKDAKPLELKPEKLIEKYGQAPTTDDNRNYLLKKGRFGMFWAHPDYPKVKDIKKVQKPGMESSEPKKKVRKKTKK